MKQIKQLKKDRLWIIFLVFLLATLLYAIFSKQFGFHDVHEYLIVAKELAGYGNVKIFSAHSIVYPFFVSFFLKIFPSILTYKIINVLWLSLDALLLWLVLKNRKAFWLWIFSPLIWILSIQFSPILPTSFFMLLAYALFKKYETNKKLKYFIGSGLALGVAASLYMVGISLAVFFVLSFLYDQKFKKVILYVIIGGLTFSIRLIIDYVYFNFPFYSLTRFLADNLIVSLGFHPQNKLYISPELWILFIIGISPFLFRLYKLKFKEHKKEIFFVILSTILLGVYGTIILYFLVFSAILLVLLSKVLTKKEIFINSVISLVIIVFLTASYFNPMHTDILFGQDIEKIQEEFGFKEIVAGKDFALTFSSYFWDKDNMPRIIWMKEYELSLKNETNIVTYTLRTDPNLNTLKIFEVEGRLERNGDEIFYDDLPIVMGCDDNIENYDFLEGYSLTKEYQKLCLYQK